MSQPQRGAVSRRKSKEVIKVAIAAPGNAKVADQLARIEIEIETLGRTWQVHTNHMRRLLGRRNISDTEIVQALVNVNNVMHDLFVIVHHVVRAVDMIR